MVSPDRNEKFFSLRFIYVNYGDQTLQEIDWIVTGFSPSILFVHFCQNPTTNKIIIMIQN